MDDQLEELLGAARAVGTHESAGSFTLSLEGAREKLAEFGQVSPALWTLKFFQCMQMLDCSRLKVRVNRKEWVFTGVGPCRELDPARIHLDLHELGLGRQTTAEHCLARAVVGLRDVVSVEWMMNERRHLLCGVASAELEAGRQEVVLRVEFSKNFPFPGDLWDDVTQFAPMELEVGKSPSRRRVSGPPVWLESYFVHGPGPRICPRSRGNARVNLAEPLQDPRQQGISTIFRHLVSEMDSGCDVLVLVRAEFKSPSQLWPIQAGCLLQSFEPPQLPPGLVIVFAADGLPTDLSQFRLRNSPELRERLLQIGALLPQAIQPLLNQWQPNERLVKHPRSSAFMDFIPAVTGLLGVLPTVGLLFYMPLAGLVAGLITLGLPGAYFKVSRSARRAEFDVLLNVWKKKTEDLFTSLGRMSYVQYWEGLDL